MKRGLFERAYGKDNVQVWWCLLKLSDYVQTDGMGRTQYMQDRAENTRPGGRKADILIDYIVRHWGRRMGV
jgi:hypothetical protein